MTAAKGIDKAAEYAHEYVTRFTVNAEAGTATDMLNRDELRAWIDGRDPNTRELRGRKVSGANADLLFDATVNTPKSLSVAAMLDPDLKAGLDRLHEKIRDRAMALWLAELNARRGAGGKHRMDLAQVEIVELNHERSRALDPHAHRHLWLNARVLGSDGRWSNLDSRVMLRFQTVLNAEGDLATVTDPEWRALLASKGLSVDSTTGEIAELAHLTAPLSRRHRQIETARSSRLAQWHDEHPGMSPSPLDLRAIDQWAWAYGRPNKPQNFDEGTWRDTVLSEIRDIDGGIAAALDSGLPPVIDRGTAIADIDRDWLALAALAEADARSTSASGRFSEWDVLACAERALAATGVIADRALLDDVIDDVVARALDGHVMDLAHGDPDVPPHLRHYVARDTAVAKIDLDARFAELANGETGVFVAVDEVTAVAATVTEHGLDEAQSIAAAAVAGSDRIVTVVGPAGAGKTTMLTVARHLLVAQGRNVLLVAPTKKAASVAGRETGAPAASMHQVLHEFGFRWSDDFFGRTVWQRLQPGDTDPQTGLEWQPRPLAINASTRIIVDEAGMVDLHAARALAVVAEETGADLAFVGDPMQVLPVGHSGAMALAQRHANAGIELESIHRFRKEDGTVDAAWADLSRRLRSPGTDEQATMVALELLARDRVRMVSSTAEANQTLVESWCAAHGRGDSAAVIVATNEDARAVNEAIQDRRLEQRQLDTKVSVEGMDGQRLFIGDVVQTRKNDRGTDVENRALWRVVGIDADNVTLASTGVDDMRRTVPRGYAAIHVQLAYASTVHGIQGETVQRAIVGPGVDAAGLYVGLTRGKRSNEVVIVAGDENAAVTTLVEQMRRGQLEVDLDQSRQAVLREMAAAAKRDGSGPGTPWQHREYGRLRNIDGAIAAASERIPHSHETVQAVRDRIEYLEHHARDLLRTHALEIATSDLNKRTARSVDTNGEERRELEDALQRERERLSTMQSDNAKPTRLLDALQAERNLRELVLSSEDRAYEERERETPVRTHSSTRTGHGPLATQPQGWHAGDNVSKPGLQI